MKTIKYLLFAFVAAFVFAGCSDDPTYTPGEGEDPNSYGVYFPSQENTGNVEFDPADEVVLTFKAMRKNSKDAIIVPVEVASPSAEMFTVSAIQFEEGQVETQFSVRVEGAELGETYPCTIQVTDPRFAHTYGTYSTDIAFSITRVQWNLVKGPNGETKGRWRDDLFTSMMGSNIRDNGQPNAEKEVEIYERADMPGYYRIKDIYDDAYMKKIIGTSFSNVPSVPTYTIIDARDPEKVWFPLQSAGFAITGIGYEDDGAFLMVSFVTENYPTYSSATRYGKLENGIISFPTPASVWISTASLWEDTSSYARSSDMMRLMLPGVVDYDYSIDFKSAAPADGKVEILATFGADVAKVKYAYFEGALTSAVAASKAIDIDAGTVPSEEITASGVITAELEKTGIYTLVGSSYDASGAQQSYGAVTFGYVKAGEEKPVILSVRTELTWEREPEGFTPYNSIKGIIFGEEIQSGKYGLIKTSAIAGMTQAQLETLIKSGGNAISEANLEKVNANGWAPFFTGQEKGTSYTLMVWADNGYNGQLFMAEQTTMGDPSPLDVIYTFDDALAGVPKADLFGTTWNYYAVDAGEGKTSREFLGTVTFSEDEEDGVDGDDRPVDYINVAGLSGLMSDPNFKPGAMKAYWSAPGFVYPKALCDVGTYASYYVSDYFMWEEQPTKLHSIDYVLCGVYVADGIIAFVPNDQYVPLGYTFTGMYFGAFSDAGYSTLVGYLMKLKHLLLVDPEADPNGKTAASVAKRLSGVKPATNYVELRGPALAKAVWNEKSGHLKVRGAVGEGQLTYPAVMPVKSTYSDRIVRPAGDGVMRKLTAQKVIE